ncbi:MAG: hypothetical protein PHO08_00870 [Methylococcales bacterium]|nr:hypothetical protein [Methylococcales bacterium]MDD5633509.1 hypothetical protein [Methylococcales bacterium]
MGYFARFEEIDGVLFRFDTRIYLNGYEPENSSVCVGAIIGKNPGSAIPNKLNELVPLELNGDKMLPTVRNRFIDGYNLAKKEIPSNSFVRVWNLFYICDPDLNSACQKAASYKELPICSTENDGVPIVWYGWGGYDERLNLFKERFIAKAWPQQFYYDHESSHVISWQPTIKSFAKHTQGMPSNPVNEHLANVIRSS